MSEVGGGKGKKQVLAEPSGSRLAPGTYHSIDLCGAHHPRHLVKLLGRHGQQVFWGLQPGRVADGEEQGLTLTKGKRRIWATLPGSKA